MPFGIPTVPDGPTSALVTAGLIIWLCVSFLALFFVIWDEQRLAEINDLKRQLAAKGKGNGPKAKQ